MTFGFTENKLSPIFTSFPAVDTIIVGGFVLPGRWDVEARRMWKWAYAIPAGFDGVSFTSVQTPPAEIKATGTFWTDEQWTLFKQFDSQIFKKPAKTLGLLGGATLASFALGVTHPELERLDITAVLVEEVKSLRQTAGGLWVGEVTMLEWRKGKPLPQPPKTKIPSVSAPLPTAQSQEELEAQKLLAVREAKYTALANARPR